MTFKNNKYQHMNLKIIMILSVCVLLAACQKRKYADEQVQLEKEDIYFNGYFGNEPIALKIGTEGYYCYSSYNQHPDSVYVFEGTLKKFDCNPCPLSLHVELSDYRKSLPGTSILVDSSLRTGRRNFIPGMSQVQMITLTSHSNKEVSSLRWDLSNGGFSEDSIFNCDFGQPGPQTVSLTVLTKGNCESVVVNKIFVGGESGLFACGITAVSEQNNSSNFSSNKVGGKAPFIYTWYFGDGTTSSSAAPNHSYIWSGSYPVKLRIEDAEHHICESNYIYVSGNDKSSCSANMSVSYTGSKNVFLNGVKIQWTDASNVVLSSDSIAQPAESYFEILNSQAYAPNEKGEPGRLLTLRFNVLLSNGSRKVWFKSDTTAIAVTYK